MAKYTESVACNYSHEVKWGLCHSAFRYNGYEIIYSDEQEICGGIGINLAKVWVHFSSLGMEVSCNGMLESWCKKQVEALVTILKSELARFNPDRHQQYLKVTKELMPTLGYSLPDSLPSPEKNSKSNPFYPVVSAFLLTSLSVFLFWAMWSETENWSIAIAVLFIIALGNVIRYTAEFAQYRNWKVLQTIVILSSLSSGAALSYIAWKNDFFDNRIIIETIVVLFVFFLLPGLIGLIILKEGKRKAQKGSIPDEALVMARYLKLNHHSESGMRNELSKRGWQRSEDQDKVFQALRAYHELQAEAKIHATKK
jgi:hypothetical protein